MQNFVDAIRAERPEAARLRHRSKATCRRRCRTWQTSPIASAISCGSIPKAERFEDDKKADALLNRDGGYRKGFEIPKSFT